MEYLGSQPSYTKELHNIAQSINRLERNLDDLFRKVQKFPSKTQVEELLKFPETIYGEISVQLAESKKREEAINQHIKERFYQ